MIKKSFEQISQSIGDYLKGMKYEQTENTNGDNNVYSAVYTGEKRAFRLSYDTDSKKYSLDTATVKEDSIGNFRNISVWLFDAETDGPGEIRSITSDFQETIADVIRGKAKINVERDDIRAPKNVKVDYETFCKNAVEKYPDFAGIYDANVEHYGRLNPDQFAKDSLGKYMLEMLSMKKNAQLKKLFEFYDTMFSKGDDDVGSIIVVTIFGMLLDNEAAEQLAYKYMSDSLKPVWEQVRKLLLKKR